jgi:acetyl esterase/lipase
LTANDPAFQPGFEQADTSVAGIVGLYGYYGGIASRESLPSSPFDYAERGSAPLILVHGEQDTFTSPARALALAQRARQASHNPVVYVELPGAQHSFDLLASIRFEAVIDGIEAFADWVRSRDGERIHGVDAERTSLVGERLNWLQSVTLPLCPIAWAIMQAEAARGIPAGLDARRSIAEVLASQQA